MVAIWCYLREGYKNIGMCLATIKTSDMRGLFAIFLDFHLSERVITCTAKQIQFFNFVITAYHLCEWVEKDNGVGEVAKGDVKDNIRETECIKICR